MPELYSRRFEVLAESVDAASVFIDALRSWLEGQLGSLPPFGEQPWIERTANAGTVSWERFDTGEDCLCEAVWKYPLPGVGTGWWFHRSTLFRAQGSTRIELTTEYTGEKSASVMLPWPRPPLVPFLCTKLTLLVDGFQCTSNPENIRCSVSDFVEQDLLAPARVHPLLVCCASEAGLHLVSPRRIVDEFLSLARVVFIESDDDIDALAAEIGVPSLTCPPAAIRVFMPGFSRTSRPADHPLLARRGLADDLTRTRFSQRLSRWLASAQPPDQTLLGLRDRRTLERERLILDLASSRAAADAGLTEWRELAVSTDHDNQLLRSEVEHLREKVEKESQRNHFLETRIRQLSYQLEVDQESSTAEPRETEPSLLEVASVTAAVDIASELFSKTLYFIPSAFQSAEESPFARPEDVLTALQCLSEVAADLHRGELGMSVKDAFAKRGQNYASGIADHSSKRVRKQYEFTHAGSTYPCYEHLRLGSSYDPAECLRIYFCSSPTFNGRVVVGHVGRHLSTMTSTT